jgi:hypothetical protein
MANYNADKEDTAAKIGAVGFPKKRPGPNSLSIKAISGGGAGPNNEDMEDEDEEFE